MMRVGIISGILALRLGFSPRAALEAAWGGRLHDVGKLGPGILPLILNPGALEPEERRAVETHTTLGAEALFHQGDIPPDMRIPVMRAALSHHENWDGTGYPQRLKGADIQIEGRIVAAADRLDALMEHRPYRAGLSLERALQIVSGGAAAGLDPAVYSALLDLVLKYENN